MAVQPQANDSFTTKVGRMFAARALIVQKI
jgi:hypothetical protein